MKTASIGVAAPCKVSLNSMQDIPEGKYCQSCEKKVIDFTAMQESEILDWFARKAEGVNVCGMILSPASQRSIGTKMLQFARYCLAFAFISFSSILHGYGQTTTDSTKQITGVITSVDGPMGYAAIVIKDENNQLIKGTRSKANGSFALNIEGLDSSKSYSLEVSYVGYTKYLLTGLRLGNAKNLTITLSRSNTKVTVGLIIRYLPPLQPVGAPSGKTFSREELQRSPFLH